MRKIGYTFAIILWLTSGHILHAEKYIGSTNNNSGFKSGQGISAGCVPATGSTELDLNNVRALIQTGGDMWWDLQGTAQYEIPKGSGKTALFAGSIWIGGTDVNGQLKLAALRFRQVGTDYWPGPLITSGPDRGTTTSEVCLQYDRHYTIFRNQVAKFRAWYNADAETRAEDYPGYSIPSVILDWPAHGDVASGYDYYLAPFYDVDGDGYYDPYAGDYPFYDLDGELPCGTSREERIPRLFGDQTLWWVYNDRGNVHTETKGDAIGMEIRAQAFAFSTNDELNDMTFYNYALINRSTYTLIETYFGVWTDADMGYAFDDYVGCDVNRGLGYLYNGTAVDGTGQIQAYGGPTPPPPAVGVDFFEGPYQDPDGMDNPSSWNPVTGELNCDGNILNGNINGLNFGDGIVDNERWGMRRFLYFNNVSGVLGDPGEAIDYYNYLRGIWKDGTKMVYGGTGHYLDGDATDTETDFMFPGDTDPCGWGQGGQVMSFNWSEEQADNPPNDRRFVHSAGPFTLEPGAVNDITTGVVWARATGGGPYESVEEVRLADDKAQLLFDNCFKVVNGPDAPDAKFVELDKEVVFHIYNTPESNNYLEQYEEKDFSIIDFDTDGDGTVDILDKFYRFEGYQVFQFKDASVSVGDIGNINLVREVFQCDVKNDVDQLVNFTWSDNLGANIPEEMVDGANDGIKHTFTIKEDAFATNDKALVNHKRYYFAILAYGYNEYLKYDQNTSTKGQKKPYLAGRKGATGPIKVYEVIPHISSSSDGGTILNSEYGDGLEITQVEGFGSGPNIINMTKESIDQIMSGEPWSVDRRTYEKGYAPIKIKVIDPLNVPEGDFAICFDPDSADYNTGQIWNYEVKNDKWYIYQIGGNDIIDTIYSDKGIKVRNEQIISDLGLSVIVEFQQFQDEKLETTGEVDPTFGILSYSSVFSNVSNAWLSFLPDGDDFNAMNWIRSGTQNDVNNSEYNDLTVSSGAYDEDEAFEGILNGTWAPYKMVAEGDNGLAYTSGHALITFSKYRLASVDLVITADRSKWTRSCVLEMSENDSLENGDAVPALFGEGDAYKFDLRDSYSIDKDGNYASTETGSDNPNDPNYISGKGMGWFPGYAIDIETGKRLNIVYGEASAFPGENGRDMKWNPSPNVYSNFGIPLFGGKHYIYIVGDNFMLKANHVDTSVYMPSYDACKYMRTLLTSTSILTRKKAYQNFMWTSIPILNFSYEAKDFEKDVLSLSDLTISIRMANPHRAGFGIYSVENPVNDDFPRFEFDTRDIMTVKNDEETGKDALALINIVPNPYYGYSEYEKTQLENLVKITNLPKKCTISIYNVSGTLVRRFKKDSELSYQEWDLKNQYGISIASGVYIIHVDAGVLGERILKWFGALRPIDLNAF